jgi:alginate O-acetyltransferase complex protein AlgI
LSGQNFLLALSWLAGLLVVALVLPNTLQILGNHEPALGLSPRSADKHRAWKALQWRPTLPWAIALSALAVAAIMRLGGKSEFLYWQF